MEGVTLELTRTEVALVGLSVMGALADCDPADTQRLAILIDLAAKLVLADESADIDADALRAFLFRRVLEVNGVSA